MLRRFSYVDEKGSMVSDNHVVLADYAHDESESYVSKLSHTWIEQIVKNGLVSMMEFVPGNYCTFKKSELINAFSYRLVQLERTSPEVYEVLPIFVTNGIL